VRLVTTAAAAPPTLTFFWYSGFIDVNKDHGGHMFFWMFESRGNPSKDPLVLWMTGGPGCSSELAVFYEQVRVWRSCSRSCSRLVSARSLC
jgi:hypothetical protein